MPRTIAAVLILVVLLGVGYFTIRRQLTSQPDKGATSPPTIEQPKELSPPSTSQPSQKSDSTTPPKSVARPTKPLAIGWVKVYDLASISYAGCFDPKKGWLPSRDKLPYSELGKAGARFDLYTLSGKVKTVTISGFKKDDGSACYSGAVAKRGREIANWIAGISVKDVPEALAITSGANLRSIIPKQGSLADETQLRAISEFLAKKGIKTDKPRVIQHLRVDLNGDGVEEALINVRNYDELRPPSVRNYDELPPSQDPQDYSGILLRYLSKGKVVTAPVVAEIYEKPESGIRIFYRILAVLDIDSDGIKEVAVSHEYWEGAGVSIYKFDGRSVKDLLTTDCGL